MKVDAEEGEYVAEIVVRVVMAPHTMTSREDELKTVTQAVRQRMAGLDFSKIGLAGRPGSVYTQDIDVKHARVGS
jgi:hypothetical protein